MSDHGIGEAHRAIFDGLGAQALVGHTMSIAAVLGVLAGILPAVASLGAVIWYLISIYETKTVQRWVRARRHRRHGRNQ